MGVAAFDSASRNSLAAVLASPPTKCALASEILVNCAASPPLPLIWVGTQRLPRIVSYSAIASLVLPLRR